MTFSPHQPALWLIEHCWFRLLKPLVSNSLSLHVLSNGKRGGKKAVKKNMQMEMAFQPIPLITQLTMIPLLVLLNFLFPVSYAESRIFFYC